MAPSPSAVVGRIQRDIGTVAFQEALGAYVRDNADRLATTDDFLAAVRSAAPNYDIAAWERLVGLP